MRRPNIASAGVDLVGLVAALLLGLFGGTLWHAGALFVVVLALWGWTRRKALAAMPMVRRVTNGAVALVMLGVVLGLFYWIGLAVGGHL